MFLWSENKQHISISLTCRKKQKDELNISNVFFLLSTCIQVTEQAASGGQTQEINSLQDVW